MDLWQFGQTFSGSLASSWTGREFRPPDSSSFLDCNRNFKNAAKSSPSFHERQIIITGRKHGISDDLKLFHDIGIDPVEQDLA